MTTTTPTAATPKPDRSVLVTVLVLVVCGVVAAVLVARSWIGTETDEAELRGRVETACELDPTC